MSLFSNYTTININDKTTFVRKNTAHLQSKFKNIDHAKHYVTTYHMLRTLILYSNHNPCWNVSYSNSTVSCICMLTT